ncbi:MAG: hypothetical protein MJZ67_05750 [Bacteroidales bacterium]|nr:hypothetical protein [Bacteroidales bacterium]
MRAKEKLYLQYQESIHFETLLGILNDLLPLRENKSATDEYYEKKLSADLHLQEFLYLQELYEKRSVYVESKPKLTTYSGEIQEDISRQIRGLLFEIIKEDESFGYLMLHLGTEYNSLHKEAIPIDCYPNSTKIKEAISRQRDDYPKASLDDYLDDDFNYQWYKTFEKEFLESENEVCSFFNAIYKTYDQIRLLKGKTLKIREYYQNDNDYNDEMHKYYAYQYIIKSLEKFESSDSILLRVADILKDCLSEIAIVLGINSEGEGTNHSLRFADGWKEKVCVIMHVMQKLGAFERADGNKATQKQVMEHLSATFGNLDIKDPSPFIANARSNNRYERHIEELLKKATEEDLKSNNRTQ